MADYFVKIYLVLATCSGILGIVAGIFVIQQRPIYKGMPFARKLLQKNLLRGISTLLFVAIAYQLYTTDILGSWSVLIVMGVLTIGTEYVMIRLIKAGVVNS